MVVCVIYLFCMSFTFKKLHRNTISNLFRLNKRFMEVNVRILQTFLQNKDLITRFNIRVHYFERSKNLYFNQRKQS